MGNKLRKAIFLDRDGTLSEDSGYPSRKEQLQILPHVPEALKQMDRLGYLLMIISNQSGIARGYFTESEAQLFTRCLQETLKSSGVTIHASYYCPHSPEDNCACRKPKPGLILRAAQDHGIDLLHSFVVGDKISDAVAGENAGCRGVLIGINREWTGLTFGNLLEFSMWLSP